MDSFIGAMPEADPKLVDAYGLSFIITLNAKNALGEIGIVDISADCNYRSSISIKAVHEADACDHFPGKVDTDKDDDEDFG